MITNRIINILKYLLKKLNSTTGYEYSPHKFFQFLCITSIYTPKFYISFNDHHEYLYFPHKFLPSSLSSLKSNILNLQ